MSEEQFVRLIGGIAEELSGRSLDIDMESFLNDTFPADGADFQRLKKLCIEGEDEGWLMSREMGGIKFGRVIKEDTDAGTFSVDVVRMKNIRGPHHVHTKGEIGAIMSIEGAATFDGKAEGWYVYGPGTDHFPTVEGGDAYILYLLPDGEIEFTGRQD